MGKDVKYVETNLAGNKVVHFTDDTKETHTKDFWGHEVIEVSKSGGFFGSDEKIAEIRPETSPSGVTTNHITTTSGKSWTSTNDPNRFISPSDSTYRNGKYTNETAHDSILNHNNSITRNKQDLIAALKNVNTPDYYDNESTGGSSTKNTSNTTKLSKQIEIAVDEIEDQSILEDLVKNAKSIKVKKAAVKKLTNQAILGELAAHDLDLDIKKLALSRLTDRCELRTLAKHNFHEEIRELALNKLDYADWFEIVEDGGASSFTIKLAMNKIARLYAYLKNKTDSNTSKEQITDMEDNLLSLISDAKNIAIKLRAISTISNQKILNDLTKDSESIEIRRVAAINFKNQSRLSTLAKYDPDAQIRTIATVNLEDVAALKFLARQILDTETQKIAKSKLPEEDADELVMAKGYTKQNPPVLFNVTDQHVLNLFAQYDQDRERRKAAVNKIKDQTILEDIANFDESSSIKEAAVNRITNQSMLSDLAHHGRYLQTRKIAISKLKDQKTIIRLVRTDTELDIKKAAIMQVTDQSELKRFVENQEDIGVRAAAISRITDQNILIDLAKRIQDSRLLQKIFEKIGDDKVADKIRRYRRRQEMAQKILKTLTDVFG